MTEERACYYAKGLARSMGITFYVVRSREGLFMAVSNTIADCEIVATFAPPESVNETPQSLREQARGPHNDTSRRSQGRSTRYPAAKPGEEAARGLVGGDPDAAPDAGLDWQAKLLLTPAVSRVSIADDLACSVKAPKKTATADLHFS